MKTLLRSCFTLTMLIIFPFKVSANTGSGGELYEMCGSGDFINTESNTNIEELIAAGYCIGVVLAVAEMSDTICPEEGVTKNQLVLIVEKWLKNNPKDHHYAATSLVDYALSEAYPCK